MARNGSGTYSLPAGNPVVTGTTISSTVHNSTNSDIATALTNSIAKDGQTTPTADLPMGTYKHTGVGNAAARNQYAAVGQVQDQGFTWCSTAGGTADVFTLTPSPAITAYAAGQAFVFLAVGTNTTNVTCNVSGVGAKAVQASGSALAGGEIVSGKLYSVRYDGTQFQLETVSVTPFIATLLNDANAAAARTTLGAVGLADNNDFTGNNTSAGTFTFNNDIRLNWKDTGGTARGLLYGDSSNWTILRSHTNGFKFLNLAGGTISLISNAGGFYSNAATGGDKGSETLNFAAVYDNGNRVYSGSSVITPTPQALIAGAAVYSFAHTLGAVPKSYRVVLRCVTGENDWANGEEVEPVNTQNTIGLQLGADTTNVILSVNGTPLLFNKTTPSTTFTPATGSGQWLVVAYVWP